LSPLKFDLIADDRNRSWRGIRRSISGLDLKLDGCARRAANHLHKIPQGKVVRVHESVVPLCQREDAVTRMNLRNLG
jgi:hypothetical protein